MLGVSLGATLLTVTEGGGMDLLVVANSTFQYPFNVTVQLVPGSADGERREGRGGEGALQCTQAT